MLHWPPLLILCLMHAPKWTPKRKYKGVILTIESHRSRLFKYLEGCLRPQPVVTQTEPLRPKSAALHKSSATRQRVVHLLSLNWNTVHGDNFFSIQSCLWLTFVAVEIKGERRQKMKEDNGRRKDPRNCHLYLCRLQWSGEETKDLKWMKNSAQYTFSTRPGYSCACFWRTGWFKNLHKSYHSVGQAVHMLASSLRNELMFNIRPDIISSWLACPASELPWIYNVIYQIPKSKKQNNHQKKIELLQLIWTLVSERGGGQWRRWCHYWPRKQRVANQKQSWSWILGHDTNLEGSVECSNKASKSVYIPLLIYSHLSVRWIDVDRSLKLQEKKHCFHYISYDYFCFPAVSYSGMGLPVVAFYLN